MTDSYLYNAWGEVMAVGASINNHQYLALGRYYANSAVMGYQAGRRSYWSRIARFLTPDPLGAGASSWASSMWLRPMSYGYVSNRPTAEVDPTGLREFKPCCPGQLSHFGRHWTIHLGRVSTVENWIRFRLALPRAFGNVGRCIIVQEIKGSAYGANGYARTKNCGRVDIDINYPVWHPDAPSTCEYPGVTWLPSQAVWSDSPGAGTLGEDSLPFMWRTSFRTGVYDRMRLGDLSCRTFKARRPQPLRVYEWGIEFTVLKDRKGKPKVVTKVW